MRALALRYILGMEGLTCALVGVDSPEQMQNNLDLFAMGALDSPVMELVEKAVPDLPEKIIFPYLWSVRMPDIKV